MAECSPLAAALTVLFASVFHVATGAWYLYCLFKGPVLRIAGRRARRVRAFLGARLRLCGCAEAPATFGKPMRLALGRPGDHSGLPCLSPKRPK